MNRGGIWKWNISLWELYEGNLEGDLFTGDSEIMLNKAQEMGVWFHRDPISGNMEGRSFLRAFKRGAKFLFYQENFYEEFERH
jgi:hypothetical protein